MESAQRNIVSVLIDKAFSEGIISKTTYLSAKDLVYSVMDFPALLQYPVCLTKEAGTDECS